MPYKKCEGRSYSYRKITDKNIKNTISSALEIIKSLGGKIKDISLPNTKYAIPSYYILAPAEISANMAKFDGIRFGTGDKSKDLQKIYQISREKNLGDEVIRRILLGTFSLSAGYADRFYHKAQAARQLIKDDFTTAFKSVDAIISPVAPSSAFLVGEKYADPWLLYLEDIFTLPSSLAGICGISIPLGKTNDTNLPLGIQILGDSFCEEKILNIAHQMQNFEKK